MSLRPLRENLLVHHRQVASLADRSYLSWYLGGSYLPHLQLATWIALPFKLSSHQYAPGPDTITVIMVLWCTRCQVISNALCSKSTGSYVIKDFGTLFLIFSASKYFRRKFQPCPSFFSHPNIPDK